MTDTEKYAKIFRAAADGIDDAHSVNIFRADPWKVPGVNRYPDSYDFLRTDPPHHPTDDDVRRFRREEMSRETYARWSSFDGVAELFEKMAEAERQP